MEKPFIVNNSQCGSSATMIPSTKPKCRDLSVSEKIEILKKEMDEIGSITQCEAAGRLGIFSSTLCKFLKGFANESGNGKRIRSGKDVEVEDSLNDWFALVREKDARLSCPYLREKAERLAEKICEL